MEFLPKYQPRNYTYSAGGTIPTQPTGFDREAFVQACLQSERTSVTVDLSSEKKIREFAQQVEHFHPILLSAVTRWVNDPDKEHIRDCVHLPGPPAATASQRMNDRAYTFMDVIADAQRENMRKLETGDNTPIANVSFSEPWHAGVSVQPQVSKPKMGSFGRFLNWVSRGAYEKYQANKEKQSLQNSLEQKPSEDIQADLRVHNVEALNMEQVIKNDREHMAEMDRAAGLLAQHAAELAQQVERDDSLRGVATKRVEDFDLKLRKLDEVDKGADVLRDANRVLVKVSALQSEHGTDVDKFDIIQINNLNDHRPPYLNQGQSGFLDKRASATAEAYDDFFTFRVLRTQFDGKTSEEIDHLIKEDQEKQLSERKISCFNGWKNTVKLLKETPHEQWESKQNEFRDDYLSAANLYVQNFKEFCHENPMATEVSQSRTEERQAERERLLTKKAEETHNMESGQYPGVDTHGVDLSKDAQLLRKIELEEIKQMSKQLEQDRDTFTREAAERDKCFNSFKSSNGTYEPNTIMFDVPGFGRPEAKMSRSTTQILEASHAQVAPSIVTSDKAQLHDIATKRERLEVAQHNKERIDGYKDYDTIEEKYSELQSIGNEAEDMGRTTPEQRADINARYHAKIAEIAKFATESQNVPWHLLTEEEAIVIKKDLQAMQSYSDPSVTKNMEWLQENARAGTLHQAIVTLKSRDDACVEYSNNKVEVITSGTKELSQSKEDFEASLDTHKATFANSILSSVAAKASAQNAHMAPVREQISRSSLDHEQASHTKAPAMTEKVREQPQHIVSSKSL